MTSARSVVRCPGRHYTRSGEEHGESHMTGEQALAERAGAPERLRKLIHVDMDAFYDSVEQGDDPELRSNRWPLVARASAGWWQRRATRLAGSASTRRWPRSR